MQAYPCQIRPRCGTISLVDGVLNAVACNGAGVILRRLGTDPATIFLSDPALLDLQRSGSLRLSDLRAGEEQR